MGSRVTRTLVLGTLLALATLVGTPANAAAAEQIVFAGARDGDSDIYRMAPDGSGVVKIKDTPANESAPSLSPDGTQVAFARGGDIFVMHADGTGERGIASCDTNSPAWSPDGEWIAFGAGGHGCRDGVYMVRPDGTDEQPIGGCASHDHFDPTWSPDSQRVAYAGWGWFQGLCAENPFTRLTSGEDFGTDWAPNGQRIVFERYDPPGLHTINPDGTGLATIAGRLGSQPSWSPDSTRIAYSSGGSIHVMNADGTADAVITSGPGDTQPDWQAIPINSYARPKGATPTRLPLLPAYAPCASPNRNHGPPLAFPSCHPPVPNSPHLAIGTPDVNGAGAGFIGSVRTGVLAGNPATPTDEADVSLEVSATDVRCSPTDTPATCGADNSASAQSLDYTGELEAVVFVRITDKDNTPHPGGPGAATVEDFDVRFAVPCSETGADGRLGSTCSSATTVDALVPGAVKEGHRSIWEMDRVHVRDGGPDGVAATSGNRVFVRAGVFIP